MHRHLVTLLTAGLFAILIFPTACWSAGAGNEEQNRKRLDDLFRWRASDILQLDAKQDTQFAEILSRIHEKRRRAGEEMTRLSDELSQIKDKKKAGGLIDAYEKQVKIYGETQLDEIHELKKLLGTEKLGRYLVFKNDLGRKLKTALSVPHDKEATSSESENKIPEPSIIDHE